ncbi:hypothetical protein MLD38_037164 [Melastoma candidum]|uniref:Uncharacterized protein n=1 Tax=Melastoma candidum TaxID=119954 RepID=A0ACB9LL89_9MYRT|nr:hypothetical protein MLD38_037164 [Melastoma candidum]
MATTQQQLIADHRTDAEVYSADAVLCHGKSIELLSEIRLPKGLLPLDDIVEVGYNRSKSFVWLKQRKPKTHKFRSTGKTVSYDSVITAFVEDRRMKRVTGVKSKELFLWVNISDIFVKEDHPDRITFANPSGISREFPFEAFELEEEEEGGKKEGKGKR